MRSPVGEYKSEKDFKLPSSLELENFLLKVGHSRRAGTRGPGNPELAPLKDFGGRLYKSLFHGSLKIALENSLREVSRTGEGLRILLRLGASGKIAEFPWEFLYDADRSRFLSHSRRTPLVRYLEMPGRPNPLTVEAPLRVLVMISSPAGFPRLNVEEEWNQVNQALAELQGAGQIYVERLENATLANLQQRLRRGKFHVFHFIGHGAYLPDWQDGVLILEDRNGRGRNVGGGEIGGLLYDHDIRLAVLNACEGGRASSSDPFAGTAQSLIQQGLPAVVAMQFEITDVAAIAFAREFYQAISDDYPLDAAVYDGRRAILNDVNNFEWGTPVLYSRTADGRIFDVKQQRAQRAKKPPVVEPAPVEAESPAQLVDRAAAHRELGSHDEALRDLDRSLRLEPDNTSALLERSTTYWELARYREALRDLDRLLALEPANASALHGRGATYRELGRHEEALRDLDRALDLNPDDVFTLIDRGMSHLDAGHQDAVFRDLDRALQLEPDNVMALVVRGAACRELQRYDDALRDLDRLLALEPDNTFALHGRGAVHQELGRYGEALRDLDRALALEPGNAPALITRGATYRSLGQDAAAARDFHQALALDPGLISMLPVESEPQPAPERAAGVPEGWGQAYEPADDGISSLPAHGASYWEVARYGEALRDLNQAVEQDANEALLLRDRATSYMELGRYEEALPCLDRSLELDPESAAAMGYRGLVYKAFGDYSQALSDFDRSIGIDPTIDWVQEEREMLLGMLGP